MLYGTRSSHGPGRPLDRSAISPCPWALGHPFPTDDGPMQHYPVPSGKRVHSLICLSFEVGDCGSPSIIKSECVETAGVSDREEFANGIEWSLMHDPEEMHCDHSGQAEILH